MWQIQLVSPAALIGVFVFAFGLIIGSFLNVCIVRIPGRKSIVTPASACPRCGAPIRPYDNIPVVSYLLLGGRCRVCKMRISTMYPLVELLTALLFFACYRAFGLTAEGLKWAAFSALMIVLVFTDLRERILPDVVTYTGFGLGLAFSLLTNPTDGAAQWLAYRMFGFSAPAPLLSFADAVFGAAVGGGPLWLFFGGLFLVARTRRDGAGRREDDADGRCISRSKANAANHPCRLAARQRSWVVPYRVPLSLGVEIRGGVAGPAHGSRNCEDIAMCSRAALPAALRNLPGVCGNRGVPFWYASGQLVSSAPHGALMTEENSP